MELNDYEKSFNLIVQSIEIKKKLIKNFPNLNPYGGIAYHYTHLIKLYLEWDMIDYALKSSDSCRLYLDKYLEQITSKNVRRVLKKSDAILVPGGFGERGIEGMILACKYARENNVPYLGICLGMQIAIIEYARNVLKLKSANSTEFDSSTKFPVIGLITEWSDISGKKEKRTKNSDLGGTMRLGGQVCKLKKKSNSYKMYKKSEIIERHRHRYEVNPNYKDKMIEQGLDVVGTSIDGKLVEMIELPSHKWFLACQFHPEFTSNPRDGHPIFNSYIKSTITK